MYSTQKNIILKKLKFVVAGLLLITILPGNAGENYDDGETDSYGLKSGNPSGEFIFSTEIIVEPDSSAINIPLKASSKQSFGISKHNCREISSAGKSFNFYMNIQ